MSDVKMQRILSRVEPVTESGCLIWMEAVDSSGYGRIYHNGKSRKITRVLWELKRGMVPSGLCVCHTCDVPACINLEHLFLGTHTDNMRDAAKKGHLNSLPGSRHWNAKLTESRVRLARATYAKGDITLKELAGEYRVAFSTMQDAISGKKWRHV